MHLAHIPGLGAVRLNRLLQAFGSAEAVLEAGTAGLTGIVPARLAEAIVQTDTRREQEAVAAWLARGEGRDLLTLADADYPPALAELTDPPPLLYLHGRRELLQQPMLAVVGSRQATPQGRRDAARFARALAGSGLTVVSGLAAGIDAAAHEGALAAGGGTVGVIGTGIDRIYPAANRDLAHRMAAEGLLVSELPLGSPPLAAHFPRRNRVIAGLSLGCLVVEADLESGSLITARLALEAGREVFAMPGSIHSPVAKGCHALIREGAKLTECLEDILSELPPVLSPPVEETRSQAVPQAIEDAVLAALGAEILTLDSLVERTGLTVDTLLGMLLAHELAGQVVGLPGGRYQRML
ncbi:DNA-processing protein DprA [Laribacter hongkongensis]|uniref:DNA-processing protein DprA n=1 Tax=Laribacter hongkongensis TaxID=168471 RepID=UPI0027E55207|nr:DNA-processing protein DprA [Laribacter hongkongensis]